MPPILFMGGWEPMAVSLASVKTALNISSTVFDAEFTALIAAAESDLRLSGVTEYDDNDPLIIVAITAYCQANRGTETDNRKIYKEMYLQQKRNLMLASEYTEGFDSASV